MAAIVLAPLLPAHPRVEDLTSAGGAVVGGEDEDGVVVNAQLLELDLRTAEQKEADRKSFSDAEINARSKNLGLWADKDSIAPWKWRKRKK